MQYTIRPETEEDFSEIYNLVEIAFQTSEDADGDEQDYVVNLRKSENYIPELAFIILDKSKIIGHIMLTKMLVSRTNDEFEALLLSPLCVQLEYRNKGAASQLVKYSLQKAKEFGFKVVFLVGEPDFYHRFGFQSTKHFEILDEDDEMPEKYVMCIELEEGALGNEGGTISIC